MICGDDAFWIPPRLWAYVAENQPDGNLSSYNSEELSMLLGCPKHSTGILQALKDAGFVDSDGKIHDWATHNGYHEKFSMRAKIAADTRWERERQKKEDIGKRKEESGAKHTISNAPSIKELRLHGIPISEEAVIEYGQTCEPKIDAKICRKFFRHYEGQAKTNHEGQIFWVTSGGTVITNWHFKLKYFAENPHVKSDSKLPAWQQKKALEEAINLHPANRHSENYTKSFTTEQLAELKELRRKFAEVTKP